jgi:hypothetical protein
MAADTGSAYVYSGTDWWREQELMVADGTTDDYFGFSLDMSGDGSIIVIGAHGDDDNGSSSGSVYVCTGSFWSSVVKLRADDGGADDFFGYSVAISGDGSTIVVGAYGDDDSGSSAGAVYVYTGTDWSTETKILAGDGEAEDRFGRSVGVSADGSIIVAGSYLDDDKGSSAGAVYVFTGTGWAAATKLAASDGSSGDNLGYCVAISEDGTTIAAGAPGDDENGSTSGAAYLFHGSGWSMETKILPSDGAASDNFGSSAAISSTGDTVLIGAYGNDDFGPSSGSAYLFEGLSWATELYITQYDNSGGDYSGHSVALSSNGEIILTGAYGDDDNGDSSGSAYIIP